MNARWLTVAVVIVATAFLSSAQVQQSAAQLYQSGVYAEEIEGNLQKAIGIYEQVLRQFPDDAGTGANAQLHIGLCYERMGLERAREAYEKVISDYPAEAVAVAVAREKLDNLLRARSIPAEGDRGLTVRQVPAPADWEGPGVVSPDGKYLADVEGNSGDLWVSEIVGGRQRRVTDEGKDYSQYAFCPRWSPDSAKLAFTWVNAKNVAELREAALGGARPRVLIGGGRWEWVTPTDWSPDGKYILVTAFVYKQRSLALGLVSLTDGSFRSLRTFEDRNLAPVDCRVSPDGLGVAYSRPTRRDARERDVFLLSLDASRETPLIQHPADDVLLEWLPGGRGLLFTSDRAGSVDLWMLEVDKGQARGTPTLVKRSIGPVRSMGLTAAGAFYYRTPGSSSDVYTAGLDPGTGRVAGSPKMEPLPFEGHNTMPDWSPDGRRLVYSSTRPGEKKAVLCVYSVDAGKVREYRLDKTYVYPRWTPDGRHIILQATVADGQGIHRLDVESGVVTPLLAARDGEYLHDLRVSPDGRWMVYGRDTKSICQIMRRDAVTGVEQPIDSTPFDNSTLALSRDGSRLAMILRADKDTRILKVMEFPDGAPTEVHRFAQTGRWIIDLVWSPDGRFICYSDTSPGSDGNWRLRRVPAEGGPAQDLGVVMRHFRQISAHPDGSRITFSSFPSNPEPSQVWVLDNLPAAKR